MTEQASKTPENRYETDRQLRAANDKVANVRSSRVKWSGASLIVGIVGTVIVGFSFMGWSGPGSTEEQAVARADAEVGALLAPFCVEKAQADESAAKLAEVAAISQPNRQLTAIMNSSWVVVEGFELSNARKRALAEACQQSLFPPPVSAS
ncbi:hypothetical protein COU18_01350 [Candidatus Kaiserbacteria bacterium CG10_big_fil_rev_8_21_14_0_10_51_14]|uniref:Uncharacterized protein n=1 Tax=Candidatus Kaiserbacteria bacterium CG10_big_fil_rev_8_21_14_0_10_51_14 TaxID=1974610 RepID=A0A2H0UC73_9BACT|nr:MAG: hypothetical protein COU18_01350 [Candidatus Kaiserbacteria bacterium CG10_big_fil_rev_8_21_14_0_10_51_14]